MDLRRIVVALVAIGLLYVGWQAGRWSGVAFVASGMVMVALIQVNKMIQVLRGASDRPQGRVGSAVMLNAQLKRGLTLLRVIATTQSVGEPLSSQGADPESFRWTDESGASVTCEFLHGRLQRWTLSRPGEGEG